MTVQQQQHHWGNVDMPNESQKTDAVTPDMEMFAEDGKTLIYFLPFEEFFLLFLIIFL